jgi:methylmalonyl-CoA/ethylmalonyl-CoA epimerase
VSLPIRSLDHTAIAVRSIEAALPFYRDVLGGDPQELSERPEKGFRALTFRFPGGGGVELIEPLGESSFLHTFLEKRGEGVHHLTFMVSDLRAAVAEARAAGLRVVDEDYADPTWQEAFISPRSAHGTIVQLAQSTLDLEQRRGQWPPDGYR